jgi:hypothetical protein
MKMTFTESQFEVPDGKYTAKFLGVTLREDKPGDKPRLGQDGKPLPPAMTWDFEIQDQPHMGKKVDKLTGRVPGPKNGCGKMLVAITDTILKSGAEIDTDQFIGKLYRITCQDSRVSESPGPVLLHNNGQTPSAPALPREGPPAVEAGRAALLAAGNADELKAAWNGLEGWVQKALVEVRDRQKAAIDNPAAPESAHGTLAEQFDKIPW